MFSSNDNWFDTIGNDFTESHFDDNGITEPIFHDDIGNGFIVPIEHELTKPIFHDMEKQFQDNETHYLSTSSFEDYDIDYDAEYFYRVSYVVDGQMSHYSNVLSIILESMQNIEELIITSFSLNQNYPNPFNPTTKFTYTINSPGMVSLKIYNVMGKLVRTIFQEYKEEGTFEVHWNGLDDNRQSISSGIYFYRFSMEGKSYTKKMILSK